MSYKSKRSKACDIPQKVREIVGERDGHCCIVCGRQGVPNAHYISRARGGLGIPQNIVTLCPRCHNEYDNGKERAKYKVVIKDYLQAHYDGWNEEDLIYRKWRM
jgi:5-methylcytosine-specific restriction endonuclease McrA